MQIKPKLLLIEPDEILRDAYVKELCKKYIVSSCTTAEKSLKMLTAYTPDLILLEILLPFHNGLDIIYDLQSYTENRDIPVIILSYLTKNDLGVEDEDSRRLSIYNYLYKPTTTPKQLLVELKKLNMVQG